MHKLEKEQYEIFHTVWSCWKLIGILLVVTFVLTNEVICFTGTRCCLTVTGVPRWRRNYIGCWYYLELCSGTHSLMKLWLVLWLALQCGMFTLSSWFSADGWFSLYEGCLPIWTWSHLNGLVVCTWRLTMCCVQKQRHLMNCKLRLHPYNVCVPLLAISKY